MKGINPNCFGEGDHNLPNCECRLIYERIRNAENSVASPRRFAAVHNKQADPRRRKDEKPQPRSKTGR
jgi:hypothetical protein